MSSKITIQGKVSVKLVAQGSKSERKTHIIELDNGGFYLLRLKGGNAMYDSRLDALTDHTVEVTGIDHKPTFIIESYTILT